jgi:hypothetical protein
MRKPWLRLNENWACVGAALTGGSLRAVLTQSAPQNATRGCRQHCNSCSGLTARVTTQLHKPRLRTRPNLSSNFAAALYITGCCVSPVLVTRHCPGKGGRVNLCTVRMCTCVVQRGVGRDSYLPFSFLPPRAKRATSLRKPPALSRRGVLLRSRLEKKRKTSAMHSRSTRAVSEHGLIRRSCCSRQPVPC